MFHRCLLECADIFQTFPSFAVFSEIEALQDLVDAEEIQLRRDLIFIYERAKKLWIDEQFQAASLILMKTAVSNNKGNTEVLKEIKLHNHLVLFMTCIARNTETVPWFNSATLVTWKQSLPKIKEMYEIERIRLLYLVFRARLTDFVEPFKEYEEIEKVTDPLTDSKKVKLKQERRINFVRDVGHLVYTWSVLHEIQWNLEKLFVDILKNIVPIKEELDRLLAPIPKKK